MHGCEQQRCLIVLIGQTDFIILLHSVLIHNPQKIGERRGAANVSNSALFCEGGSLNGSIFIILVN